MRKVVLCFETPAFCLAQCAIKRKSPRRGVEARGVRGGVFLTIDKLSLSRGEGALEKEYWLLAIDRYGGGLHPCSVGLEACSDGAGRGKWKRGVEKKFVEGMPLWSKKQYICGASCAVHGV